MTAPPIRVPCLESLWLVVAYFNDIISVAQVQRRQVSWHVQPAMWRLMRASTAYKEAIHVDYDKMREGEPLSWTLFGYPVVLDLNADHPSFVVALDCVRDE